MKIFESTTPTPTKSPRWPCGDLSPSMASRFPPFDISTMGFYIIAAMVCLVKIITTSIAIALASIIPGKPVAHDLAASASVFGSLDLIILFGITALFLRRSARYLLMSFWTLGIVIGFSATALSLSAFGSALYIHPDSNGRARHDGLAKAGIALTVLGVLTSPIFFTWTGPRQDAKPSADGNTNPPRLSAFRSTKQQLSLTLTSLSPSSPTPFHLSSRTSSPASERMTVKQSASHVLRPMTSRTRLITGAPRSDSGIDVSIDSMSHHGDFDQWDTSSVEAPINSFYAQLPPRARLEPIPGSRPHSPARLLDGPFPGIGSGAPPAETSLPETPPRSPFGGTFGDRRLAGFLSRPTTAQTSHDESHIHPLFRSESPAPPPYRSPGTTITASPFGGQIIQLGEALASPRLLGSAHGSGPASPSLPALCVSPTGSDASFRTVPGSPPVVSPIDRRAERNLFPDPDTTPLANG